MCTNMPYTVTFCNCFQCNDGNRSIGEDDINLTFSVGGTKKGHVIKIFPHAGRNDSGYDLRCENGSFSEVFCHPYLQKSVICCQIMEYINSVTDPSLQQQYSRLLHGRDGTTPYSLTLEYTATVTPCSDSGIQRYMVAAHQEYYRYGYTDGGPGSKNRLGLPIFKY